MAKAKLKTKPTRLSVRSFLDGIQDENRRRDCKTIARLMREISGERPVMWGPSIVGYGKYHYKYDSGREGDFFRLGFSPRKQDLTIYIMPGYTNYDHILTKLGKHRKGKSCLYIKRLDDIDLKVLERLIRAGWRDMQRLYPR